MQGYHPARKEREIIDPDQIKRILKISKYVTIAMADSGEPYIVTLSYGYCETENALYFHCSNAGMKLDFLRRNSRVCATIIEDHGYVMDRCEHEYASLVIRGEMEIIEGIRGKKAGLDALMKHLEYKPDPIKDRNIYDDGAFAKVTILKMNIASVIGKQSRDVE